MKALVTGSTGMIGSHFVREFRRRGWAVAGLARSSASSRLHDSHDYPVRRFDMLDRGAIDRVLREEAPDVVVHMAAQAFNGSSWESEETTYQANVMGTLNVLGAVRRHCPRAKLLLACSSAEYGDVRPEECPLPEDRPLRPLTPYGVTKVATECIGRQHFSNYGMPVYLPRLFIHVGTGHPPATAVQNFARQLALIARGKAPPLIKVGRLDTARDLIDVRDGVEGMLLLLEKGPPGTPVNICNGEAVRMDEVLRRLVALSGLDVEVREDPELLRPSDEPLLLGDNSRLRALGWCRRYPLEDTLGAVYSDWLGRV